MGAPAVGAVVLIPFPFSDLSGTKKRPALVLADVGRGDWVCTQINDRRARTGYGGVGRGMRSSTTHGGTLFAIESHFG
jgi:hypothetical protein